MLDLDTQQGTGVSPTSSLYLPGVPQINKSGSHDIADRHGGFKDTHEYFYPEILVFRRSGCCLAPNEHFLQIYYEKNKFLFNEMVMSALYQTNMLYFIVLSHGNNGRGQTCCSTRTPYPESEPTSRCSYYIMVFTRYTTDASYIRSTCMFSIISSLILNI